MSIMSDTEYRNTEAIVTAIRVCIENLPLAEFVAVLDGAARIERQAECCEAPEVRAARCRMRLLAGGLLSTKMVLEMAPEAAAK